MRLTSDRLGKAYVGFNSIEQGYCKLTRTE